ncbi:hypothetical protein QDX91_004644 [Salmonella enterica]|nr:hypothetical protein [Salmonella enterica subsp. enterica serovar Sandiego]EJW2129178.1 hypothetical protein [Salmonella enterica]EKT1705104.1 hypothetical protein [Salmonella enterica]ELC6907455.1 hypothetical protein [Salmonella enterica]
MSEAELEFKKSGDSIMACIQAAVTFSNHYPDRFPPETFIQALSDMRSLYLDGPVGWSGNRDLSVLGDKPEFSDLASAIAGHLVERAEGGVYEGGLSNLAGFRLGFGGGDGQVEWHGMRREGDAFIYTGQQGTTIIRRIENNILSIQKMVSITDGTEDIPKIKVIIEKEILVDQNTMLPISPDELLWGELDVYKIRLIAQADLKEGARVMREFLDKEGGSDNVTLTKAKTCHDEFNKWIADGQIPEEVIHLEKPDLLWADEIIDQESYRITVYSSMVWNLIEEAKEEVLPEVRRLSRVATDLISTGKACLPDHSDEDKLSGSDTQNGNIYGFDRPYKVVLRATQVEGAKKNGIIIYDDGKNCYCPKNTINDDVEAIKILRHCQANDLTPVWVTTQQQPDGGVDIALTHPQIAESELTDITLREGTSPLLGVKGGTVAETLERAYTLGTDVWAKSYPPVSRSTTPETLMRMILERHEAFRVDYMVEDPTTDHVIICGVTFELTNGHTATCAFNVNTQNSQSMDFLKNYLRKYEKFTSAMLSVSLEGEQIFDSAIYDQIKKLVDLCDSEPERMLAAIVLPRNHKHNEQRVVLIDAYGEGHPFTFDVSVRPGNIGEGRGGVLINTLSKLGNNTPPDDTFAVVRVLFELLAETQTPDDQVYVARMLLEALLHAKTQVTNAFTLEELEELDMQKLLASEEFLESQDFLESLRFREALEPQEALDLLESQEALEALELAIIGRKYMDFLEFEEAKEAGEVGVRSKDILSVKLDGILARTQIVTEMKKYAPNVLASIVEKEIEDIQNFIQLPQFDGVSRALAMSREQYVLPIKYNISTKKLREQLTVELNHCKRREFLYN